MPIKIEAMAKFERIVYQKASSTQLNYKLSATRKDQKFGK